MSQIAGCFFIFDRYIEDETADPADCPLFFHPRELPMEQQSSLLGYVSAMAVFVEGFGGAELTVVQLQRAKMAVKRAEGLTLVLAGRGRESDEVIKGHLDDIYNAFRFFYGSFASVLRALGGQTMGPGVDRKEVLRTMRRVGEELLPLVDSYGHSLFASFNPLPFTVLAPHSARLVVRASQLLMSAAGSGQAGNLGGAVFCSMAPGQTSVLCTQLPSTPTRWICCRVSHAFDSLSLAGQSFLRQRRLSAPAPHDHHHHHHPSLVSPVDALLISQCDVFNVMLPAPLVVSLRRDVAAAPVQGALAEWAPRPLSSRARLPSGPKLRPTGRQLEEELGLPPAPEGHIYAGLLIVYVGLLCAAVVMELDWLYDEEHIQRVRALCDSRLISLEQEMRTLLAGNSAAPAAVVGGGAVAVDDAGAAASAATGAAASGSASSAAGVGSPVSLSSSSSLPSVSSSSVAASPAPSAAAFSSLASSTSASSLLEAGSSSPFSPPPLASATLTSASPFRSSASKRRGTSSANFGNPLAQHWMFTHDDSTGSSLVGCEGPATGQVELLSQARTVHDLFVSNPNIQQVLLRNGERAFVCKRQGPKEVYFMQQPAPASCFDLEVDARRVLLDNYEVRIL